ncbi:DsbA family protein [Rhodopseudomonas sp. P2A-2r]|uniref:DsbA family protein n=1 Tax=unclassified Rhodopseudomonas TaxID=2638247 RepID=UPI002234530A|nr:DsbA family protein [Rhodopseudomonas sp. P2A-2r]UZE46927.1 DsbA family protein [Rhodopseudomonas sp. P2A-2r]
MKTRRNFLATAFIGMGGLYLTGVDAAAQSAADAALSRDAVLRDKENPILGNPDGNLTVASYFDYQCPYCKRAEKDLRNVAGEDGQLRIVLKDWPILGGASGYAAKLTLATKYQGKHAEAHAALMQTSGRLSEGSVRDYLQKAGIDVARATQDLATYQAAVDAVLARNNAQAEAFGFQGTPAFIIGTFRVPGVLDAAGFKLAIADARKAAAK